MFSTDYRQHNQQRISFLKQLSVILSSGLPLMRGLELLEQGEDKELGAVCRRLNWKLAAGGSLSSAMSQPGMESFFPELVVRLVAAGEECGKLQEILAELAAYYTRQQKIRRLIWRAAYYPLFLLAMSFLLLCFFLLHVLPALASVYQGMGAQLSCLLVFLLNLQDLLLQPAYPLLGVLLVSCFALYVRRNYALWLPKFPFAGGCYQLVYEVRFCRLLALLLETGVEITQAVEIVGGTIADSNIRRRIVIFSGRLQRGNDISLAIRDMVGVLSPLSCELLAVGAATGYLPQLLQEAARISDAMLQERLVRLKEFLAPCLLLVAALAIGLLVCAIIGPLFGLVSALPEYN